MGRRRIFEAEVNIGCQFVDIIKEVLESPELIIRIVYLGYTHNRKFAIVLYFVRAEVAYRNSDHKPRE